jgi:hypothetical protein
VSEGGRGRQGSRSSCGAGDGLYLPWPVFTEKNKALFRFLTDKSSTGRCTSVHYLFGSMCLDHRIQLRQAVKQAVNWTVKCVYTHQYSLRKGLSQDKLFSVIPWKNGKNMYKAPEGQRDLQGYRKSGMAQVRRRGTHGNHAGHQRGEAADPMELRRARQP